jgi:DNA mismatch repair protein MutL
MQDGKLKLFLPTAPLKTRFAAAVPGGAVNYTGDIYEIAASGKGFFIKIVIGGPMLCRNDRRRQYIFANGRRIYDFSLQQALEYGSQGFFPNGLHPIGAVFIEVDPARADFNVHPAKREARLADSAAIHHEITTTLRSFFRHLNLNHEQSVLPQQAPAFENFLMSGESGGPSARGTPQGEGAFHRVLSGDFVPLPGRAADRDGTENSATGGEEGKTKLRYAGRIFDFFILVEDGERLYIIDQHAAHERILYDRFLSGPLAKQELLVPITFLTESRDDDEFLEARKPDLARLGIVIEGGQGSWRIEALPVLWRLSDGETVDEILGLRAAGENIAERWAATLACHSAVRDGDYLDSETALSLAERALALPIKRCPHGRPILTEIKAHDILRAVKRIS